MFRATCPLIRFRAAYPLSGNTGEICTIKELTTILKNIIGLKVITVTASAILSPPTRGSITNSANVPNLLPVNHTESSSVEVLPS